MKKRIAFISILIGLLFFLNSSQYLSWFYILPDYYDSFNVDFYGQFLGKIFQGLGIVFFCAYVKYSKSRMPRIIELSSFLAINFLLTAFSIISTPDFCIALGLLMNIAIGILYAWYVELTIEIVPTEEYGLSFGLGIGLSCVFSYFLYKFNPDYTFVKSKYSLLLYAFISIITIIIFPINEECTNTDFTNETTDDNYSIANPALIRAIVFTFLAVSIVNGLGYFQPSGDIATFHISVEVMRLFYTIGLVIAGFINDKSRKIGLILCLIALTFAFSMPLLRDNQTGVYITWIITYLLGGFISVCRAIVFLDIAIRTKKSYIAPLGLFLGRIGEPIGMIMRFKLENNNAFLVLVLSLFFAITLILFALVFTKSFVPTATLEVDAVDYRALFIDSHGLSTREIQILDEILAMKSNKEIAASLYITESTVKFHVKNLMKKTNCKNRNELINLYNTKSAVSD